MPKLRQVWMRWIILCIGLIGFCGVLPAQSMDTFARRVFERINEVRALFGIDELVWSESLAQCAREQSIRKAALRFPGHTDPEHGGVADRLQTAGIRWQRCGENIFTERGWDDPVDYAAVFWWYSPAHKANMMDPDFTQTGIGVSLGADGTYVVTQIFVLPPVLPLPRKRR